ncbi:MAG: helix-turn-helix transcriptional regulator [Hungatella sp.]
MNEYDKQCLLECVAHRIRAERRKSGMSMEQLAELSNVSLQTIKDIEHAKRACQIDTLVSITSSLNLSTDFVLGMLDFSYKESTPDFKEIYDTLSGKQRDFLQELANIIMVKMPR